MTTRKAKQAKAKALKLTPDQGHAHRMLVGMARLPQSMRAHFTRLAYANMDAVAADKAAAQKAKPAAPKPKASVH